MSNLNPTTLSETIRHLQEINHPDSLRIAQEIILHTNGNQKRVSRVLSRLKKDEPWEYIRGFALFCDQPFEVDENTLIPRIETEKLIEIVSKNLASTTDAIIDVGTGSGNIICCLAKKLKINNISYIGLDISEKALKIAKKNVVNLKLSKDIELKKSPLLKDIDLKGFKNIFVVANLPYIPKSDYDTLSKSVLDYEPKNALLGGENGYELIIELIKQIVKNNVPVSKVALEIDPIYATKLNLKLKKLLPQGTIVKVYKDFYEKDRFLLLNLPLPK